jgi:hypothetical protein
MRIILIYVNNADGRILESDWATAGSHGVFVDDRSGAVTYLRTPKGQPPMCS